jgi:hypothetical protein
MYACCLLQLDDWMEAHEAAEAAREAARQAAMAEDGWTVVVRSKVSQLRACTCLHCLHRSALPWLQLRTSACTRQA